MDNIKAALGKSSNNQRATRPGVVQITHNNDDEGGSVANVSVATTSAGEECSHPLAAMPELVVAPGTESGTTSQMDPSELQQQPQIARDEDGAEDPGDHHLTRGDANENTAISDSEDEASQSSVESPPDTTSNSGVEEIVENSSENPSPHQQQEGLLTEESLVDAEVELIDAEEAEEEVDEEAPGAAAEDHRVTSVHLTQSSFPVAQAVDNSVEEYDEEEGEGLIINVHEGEEDNVSLDESENVDYDQVILIRQEVALATTDGGDDHDVERQSTWGEDEGKQFRFFPKKRSRRILCGVMVGVLAVAACVVGVVVGVNVKNNKDGGRTKTAGEEVGDLSVDDDANVVEVLLQNFLETIGTDEHKIPGTPQYRAIQWLYESSREGIERFNLSEWAIRQLLVQRYVVTVFYYATGNVGWEDDCGFITTKHECEWKCAKNSNLGITCNDSNRIQKILLPNNSLSGRIPIELSALASLEELDISDNNIGGQLPENIGDLRSMKSFNAAHNELTGSLPSSFGNMSFLRFLNLMDNNLIGEIPPEVTRLGLLTNLWLSGNGFTGGMNSFCDAANRFRISTFYADCPSITCDCCTHCCDASSCQPRAL